MKALCRFFGLGLLASVVFLSLSQAENSSYIDCPRHWELVGKARVIFDRLGNDKCYASVSNHWTQGQLYRSYLMTTKGLLMVFNSFGAGPGSTHTGAREFYFFPRSETLALKVIPSTLQIQVQLPNGDLAEFDPETAQIRSLRAGQVQVAEQIVVDNAGGVEIPRYQALILDSGFLLGGSPSNRPLRDSVFRDSNGRSCSVRNSEIFNYVDGETEFKFADREICSFLNTRCPSLSCNF